MANSNVRQDKAERPKVLIYDVVRSDDRDGLARRGNRTSVSSVCWVCAMRPDIYQKMKGRRIFLGMTYYRVV